jgi:hypothetical protein
MDERSPDRRGSVDRELAALAARQHGVVSRAQLAELGVGRGALERRLAADRLHRVHAGVYLVGHRARAPLAFEMAAVLACGAGAVISHRSAAAIWGLVRDRPVEDDVTVSSSWSPRRPGIRVRRTDSLDPRDVARFQRIPETSTVRTVLDVAAKGSEEEIEQVVAQLYARRLARPEQVRELLERARGRPGVGLLRSVLQIEGGPALTRSVAEQRMLRLVRGAGLPLPDVNARLFGFEIDFLWRAQRLALEVDGFAYHADPVAFQRDRLRDAELAARGWAVMRVTWHQLTHTPEQVLSRLRAALIARRSGNNPSPG